MADQQIIDYGATANDGTGDTLRNAFIKVDDNFSAIWEAGPVGSNVVISNNTIEIIDTNGNLVLKPNGIGTVQVRNSVLPVGNNIYNLGSANAVFRSLYLGSGGFTTSGNITADYFIGDGSLLTNITAAGGTAIVNGTSNVRIGGAGANVTVGVAGVGNVAVFSSTDLTISGNLLPAGNVSKNIGSPTNAFNDLYLANSTIFLGNATISANATSVIMTNESGQQTVITGSGTLTSYGNANVAANLAAFGSNPILTTGNVTAGFFLGNGSQLSGITANYSNANVAAYLPTYSGAITAANVSASGNVTGAFIKGDGSLLTNITVAGGTAIVNGTSNVVVASSGNITVGVAGVTGVATFTTNGLTVPGNVAAGNISGNGAALTSVSTDRGSDTNNWDALTQMGAYKVNRVSWSGTTGTPTDSAVFVGLLQVITAGDTTTQMFFPGTVQAGNEQIQWNRTLWSGTWTNWTKIINNGQIIDAGSF